MQKGAVDFKIVFYLLSFLLTLLNYLAAKNLENTWCIEVGLVYLEVLLVQRLSGLSFLVINYISLL